MSRKTIPIAFVACFVFSIVLAAQQSAPVAPAPPKSEPPSSSAEDLPTTRVDLSSGKPVPGVDGSPVVLLPPQCTSKGDILLRFPRLPDFTSTNILSLNENSPHRFDLATVPTLQGIQVLSTFPADDEEVFLVNAVSNPPGTPEPPQTTASGAPKRTGSHYYLTIFGLDGVYKSTIKLPEDVDYRQAAELASGEFLVLGYDKLNRVARLQLLDDHGGLIRSIEIPAAMLTDAILKKAEDGTKIDAVEAGAGVSRWQIASTNGKVVLYQPYSQIPALEVGGGGALRELPIAHPDGLELDSLIQSNDRLLARFRRIGVQPSGGTVDSSVERKNYLLAELDRSDGRLRRVFELKTGSFFDLACEADGKLMSYSLDANSKFLVSATDIGR